MYFFLIAFNIYSQNNNRNYYGMDNYVMKYDIKSYPFNVTREMKMLFPNRNISNWIRAFSTQQLSPTIILKLNIKKYRNENKNI